MACFSCHPKIFPLLTLHVPGSQERAVLNPNDQPSSAGTKDSKSM